MVSWSSCLCLFIFTGPVRICDVTMSHTWIWVRDREQGLIFKLFHPLLLIFSFFGRFACFGRFASLARFGRFISAVSFRCFVSLLSLVSVVSFLPFRFVVSGFSTRLNRVCNRPVGYINVLTWFRGFQVKLLYLVLFSLYLSLFWEFRDKRNLKNLQFSPESLGAMLEYWYIERDLLRNGELTLKCKLKCYVKPMKNPLGVSPGKRNQGTSRGKEKILLTSVGIEPMTSGLDLPLLCRHNYEVRHRKLAGNDLGGESRRRESKGTYKCCAA